MKVTIEIDFTPIEARQFFGLPNVEHLQAKMMARVEQGMAEAIERFSPGALMGSWLSALSQSSEWMQKMFGWRGIDQCHFSPVVTAVPVTGGKGCTGQWRGGCPDRTKRRACINDDQRSANQSTYLT